MIANNNDQVNFGGNAKVLADGTVQGQQQYQDHGPAQPMNVHSTVITATTCSQDRTTASIYGKATIDGAGSHVFRIDVTDAGSGGSNDTYGISLDTGNTSGQHPLGGGTSQSTSLLGRMLRATMARDPDQVSRLVAMLGLLRSEFTHWGEPAANVPATHLPIPAGRAG